jgi:GT2 family glycosyltransferase
MYSEEVDISLRARQAGFRIRYLQDARVVHFERGSGRSEDLDALRALNQVRLFRRYHGRAATAVLRAIIALHELSRFWKPARRRTARVTLGIDPPPSFPGAAPIQKVPW